MRKRGAKAEVLTAGQELQPWTRQYLKVSNLKYGFYKVLLAVTFPKQSRSLWT